MGRKSNLSTNAANKTNLSQSSSACSHKQLMTAPPKERNYPVSSSHVGEDASQRSKVRGQTGQTGGEPSGNLLYWCVNTHQAHLQQAARLCLIKRPLSEPAEILWMFVSFDTRTSNTSCFPTVCVIEASSPSHPHSPRKQPNYFESRR